MVKNIKEVIMIKPKTERFVDTKIAYKKYVKLREKGEDVILRCHIDGEEGRVVITLTWSDYGKKHISI